MPRPGKLCIPTCCLEGVSGGHPLPSDIAEPAFPKRHGFAVFQQCSFQILFQNSAKSGPRDSVSSCQCNLGWWVIAICRQIDLFGETLRTLRGWVLRAKLFQWLWVTLIYWKGFPDHTRLQSYWRQSFRTGSVIRIFSCRKGRFGDEPRWRTSPRTNSRRHFRHFKQEKDIFSSSTLLKFCWCLWDGVWQTTLLPRNAGLPSVTNLLASVTVFHCVGASYLSPRLTVARVRGSLLPCSARTRGIYNME